MIRPKGAIHRTTPSLPVAAHPARAQHLAPDTDSPSPPLQRAPARLPADARDLLSLRARPQIGAPRLADGRIDGNRFCDNVLSEIRRRVRLDPNTRAVVVFDLDNTLFDTRCRTLAVLRAFDAEHQTSYFSRLTISEIGWDGGVTAKALGLSESVAAAVHTFWDQHFWSGSFFEHDQVMPALADLAQQAQAAGAQVYYLSGRIDALRGPSRAQILAAGLPLNSEEHLVLKPDLGTRTSPFKADWLLNLEESGAFVGWFATDSRREIEDMIRLEGARQGQSDLPCVHVEHPLQRGFAPEGTPTIPEALLF